MAELILPDGESKSFEHQAHPVLRVYCDKEGIVCYERDGADPVRLNQVSPAASRRAAVQRCRSLLMMQSSKPVKHSQELDLQALEFMIPISPSGSGLSYRLLAEQTFLAIEQSKKIELERTAMFEAKKKRYKIK